MNLGQVHVLGGVTNIENEKKWVFLIRDVQGMGILFFFLMNWRFWKGTPEIGRKKSLARGDRAEGVLTNLSSPNLSGATST